MLYRLDELEVLAATLGLEARRVDNSRVNVLLKGAVLAFCNLPEGDSLVGFDGTPWHSHGIVQFGVGGPMYVECNEIDILVGLAAGELIVVSQFTNGTLQDRWIAHKDEPLELQHIEPGEEIRVFRLPEAQS